MPLKLYFLSASPPARAVLLTCRYLKLDVELINVDLFKGEQMKPEFGKLNPAHQVPVLIDQGFVLSESRAIMCFLTSKYQPNGSLYPTDIYKRAIIDQRLYFDQQVFERNATAIRYVFYDPPVKPSAEKKMNIRNSMSVLDTILSGSKWLAGDEITLADLSSLVNVTQIRACGFDVSQHKNLTRWLESCKSFPGFEENLNAATQLGEMVKNIVGNAFAEE